MRRRPFRIIAIRLSRYLKASKHTRRLQAPLRLSQMLRGSRRVAGIRHVERTAELDCEMNAVHSAGDRTQTWNAEMNRRFASPRRAFDEGTALRRARYSGRSAQACEHLAARCAYPDEDRRENRADRKFRRANQHAARLNPNGRKVNCAFDFSTSPLKALRRRSGIALP